MSRYDLEQAGLVDQFGSQPPLLVSKKADRLADLEPDDPRPDLNSSVITGGVDFNDRLLYALRLALTICDGMAIHFWTESDYLKQKERIDARLKWSSRSSDGDLITEYEINRMVFEEFEAVAIMVFAGLNEQAQHYRFGEVRAVTDFLYRRVVDRDCKTIVVPAMSSLPDFYEHARFREVVAPQFEMFVL